MNIKACFYLGHPAHYHLFKNTFKALEADNVEYLVLIKSKDVLERLLEDDGVPYINIFAEERGRNKLSILTSLLIKDYRIFKEVKKFKPNILIGTSVEITHVGFILRIPSLVVNEDDYDIVPEFARLGYPLATRIVAPVFCKLGKWDNKRIGYYGYHESAYLNDEVFKPSKDIFSRYERKKEQNSIFVRLSDLNAYHDQGKKGLSIADIEKILEMFSDWNIFVSSESSDDIFGENTIKVYPNHVHHVLAFTDVFIGDSQTMTAEAALLGVIAIRFNDFVGKISYLNELENVNELAYGFTLSEVKGLFSFLETVKKDVIAIKEKHEKRLADTKKELDDLTKLLKESIYFYAK